MRQIIAVTAATLRNVPNRLGSSIVVVIGITGVVAVLLSVLALANGFRNTIENTSSADRAIVLSRGAESEAGSNIARAWVTLIADAPGIARRDGSALASAETLVTAPIARKSDGLDAYVTLRGVGPNGLAVRPEIKLIAGRTFQPAVHELIVGKAAHSRFAGLELGNRISLQGGDWTVVGIFESGGNAHESSLLADSETVVSAYRMQTFQSVSVKLESPEKFAAFKDALTKNPTLDVDVWRESEYVAKVSRPLHHMLNFVAFFIGGIMAVGALFGALNTMYSAVSSRSSEIATLRAMGFNRSTVVISILVEALSLCAIGATLGALIAFEFFNGHAVSTIGGMANGSQLVYELKITPATVALAVGVALSLGLLGGLFPAIRAIRMPIPSALRET